MRKTSLVTRYTGSGLGTLNSFSRIYLLYLRALAQQFTFAIRRTPCFLWLLLIAPAALATPRILSAAIWMTQQLVVVYDHIAANAGEQAGTRLLTSIDVLLIWLGLPLSSRQLHSQFYTRSVLYFHQTHRKRLFTAMILSIGIIQANVLLLLIFSPMTWGPFFSRMTTADIARRLMVDLMGIGISVMIAMTLSVFQFWLEARQSRMLWLWSAACVLYAIPIAAFWGLKQSFARGSDLKTTITLLVQISDRDAFYTILSLSVLVWATIIGFAIPMLARIIGRYGAERIPD